MEEKLTFEGLYDAYMMCLKNKKRKNGTYSFVNEKICENLINLSSSDYGMAIGNLNYLK